MRGAAVRVTGSSSVRMSVTTTASAAATGTRHPAVTVAVRIAAEDKDAEDVNEKPRHGNGH